VVRLAPRAGSDLNGFASEEKAETKNTVLVAVAGLVALGLLARPAAAGGNGAQADTIHVSGTESFPFAPFPVTCEVGGRPVVIPGESVVAQTFAGVLHQTVAPDGQVHTATHVQDRIVLAVPGGPTYAGHFADQSNDNLNLRNETAAATSNGVLRAPDGSRLGIHVAFHPSASASGEVQTEFTYSC
jgi:hypothetical protein